MRTIITIINLLIYMGIMYLGNRFFQPYISISDTSTLIISTIILYLVSLAIVIIILGVITLAVGSGSYGASVFTVVIGIIAAFCTTPIALLFLDSKIQGFNITGFWTYILLSLVLSVCTIKIKLN